MKRRWMRTVSVLTAMVLATGGVTLLAKSDENGEHGEARIAGSIAIPSDEAILAGMAGVTLVDAIGSAVKSTPGKAVSAELEDDDGFLVYAVDIVTADNRLVEVTVDAGNNMILRTEAEDEENNEEDEEFEDENGEDEKGDYEGDEKKDIREEY